MVWTECLRFVHSCSERHLKFLNFDQRSTGLVLYHQIKNI
jgi:hypothetical protein